MNSNSTSQTSIDTKKWYLIDAKDKTLGRLATVIAKLISGKHKSNHAPYINCGDNVIVINAGTICVTGNKATQKIYRRHSGRPGGLKMETWSQLQHRIPEKILEKAVKGMLPKGSLGRNMFRNLKIYRGGTHPHVSQNPTIII